MPLRTLLRAATFAAVVSAGAPIEAGAAGFDVPVQGSRELTLAIPSPITPRGDPDAVATTIWETVRRDLDMTGYFNLIDANAHIERNRGVQPGEFDFADWRAIRADTLAKTRILPTGDKSCDPAGQKMCADVYVYYVVDGQQLASKRLRADATSARTIGHRIADTILLALVGEKGFFDGHIAAVGNQRGNKEIYVLGVDGKGVRPVTRNGSINLSPAWSPDSRTIAWTSYKRGNPDVFVKDLRSGSTRTLSNREGINISASYSPDGSMVALARSQDADSDIFLIDARTGGQIRQLTNGGGIDVSPSFTPDGETVVFASERSGGSQIYAVGVGGGTARRVTPTSGFFTDPVVSPDGRKVAFVSRSGRFDVMTVDLVGGNMQRVTQDQGDNEDPSWSPDGRYLLFTSTRDGSKKIWLSTANGRHQVAITSNGGWSQPVWSP